MTLPRLETSGVILLVEDDEPIRRLARRILEGQGYMVLEAGDGCTGLKCYEAHSHSIDLLLTDVQMPKLDGRGLAERALKLRPQQRVLFMSGYTDDVVLDERILEGTPFLAKPFTAAGLIDKVRDALRLKLLTL